MKNEIREMMLLSMLGVVWVGFIAVRLMQVEIKPNQFVQQANAAMLLR